MFLLFLACRPAPPANPAFDEAASFALQSFDEESPLNLAFAVRTIEERQGQQIGSPEEVAFEQGWISRENLQRSAARYDKNAYGAYLKSL